MRIRTADQLHRWLDENYGFEDGHVLGLSPEPSRAGDQAPSRASLELAYRVAGGYEAGGTRTLRVVRVETIGVREWTLETADPYRPDHCIEGVDTIESGDGLGLTLDVPGRLILVCSELDVQPLPDRTEAIMPRASDRGFSAVVPGRPCPTPAQWIEWLNRLGLQAVWRRYGGEAEPASHVPRDYTGWFLQEPERIAESPAGLFFFHCGLNEAGDLAIHLQTYYDDDAHELWVGSGRVIGSMPGTVVRCGNCRLVGEQWLEYLGGGGADYLDRLFLGARGPSPSR